MKQKTQNRPPRPATVPSPPPFEILADRLPALILGLTLLLAPLFPDEKLNRLKLMLLGSGLILAIVAWALLRLRERDWTFQRTPLDPYLALYALAACLYYGFSPDRAVAASEFERMIFSVGAFFAAVQACSGEKGAALRRIALSGWLAGLALIALYGLLQKSGGAGRLAVPQMARVYGTFGNPIFFAAFLVVSIPVALAACLQARSAWVKGTFLTCAVLGGAALLCTGTRAAFLALPTALVLMYGLLEARDGWTRTRRLGRAGNRLLALFFFALLAHLALRSLSPGYRGFENRVLRAATESRVTATQQTHTLIWRDVLRMWRAHPWFGTGYGTFHLEFPRYASDELKRVFPQQEKIVNDAHNEYLQILAETGLAGLAVFLALILAFYAQAWRALRAPATALLEPELLAGLLAGTAALLLMNFFSVDMRFIVSSTYLFLAMGLAASYFARPAALSWPPGAAGWTAKALWAGFFLAGSGLLTPASGPGLLPALLRPYLSQKALARQPDFFDERLLNAAQTIGDLESLVRQYPGQWKYWERLGYACAKEMQRRDPSGRRLIDGPRAQRAIEAYLKAFELNPRAAGPANNLGNIFYTLNRREEAMGWWQKTVEIDPDNLDARLNLGLAYYYQGRLKESAAQFEEVLKRDPKNDKAIVMLKRMVE